MMEGGELCSVVSSKEKPIDWRPHAHHELHLRDSHFDSRFNAYLRCELYLHQLYRSVVCSHHEELVDAQLTIVAENFSASATASAPRHPSSSPSSSSSSSGSGSGSGGGSGGCGHFSVACVTSALSNSDLSVFTTLLRRRLEAQCALVVESQCASAESAHDVLCEVAECLRVQSEEAARSERRAASSSAGATSASRTRASARAAKDLPGRSLVAALAAAEAAAGFGASNSNNNSP